jgi:mannose-1-phosphate guanylyltransferase/phosphomannomutase
MKAIILAGGEGTRLRPLSANKPKPMIRLFDRPLLEHIVLLLRSCGFTELCMTLHYLPRVIQDHFGDGSDLGVSIEYRTETEPAGTAGSVRACADFVGSEDFLVISGDAACSYDLRAMMEKHRLSGADATILVRRCEEPSEFGLVLTEEGGVIRGFVEKPGPERIVSDLINTGIYVLSPSVLKEIPEGRSVDFGGELFPRMLKSGRRLRVWESDGYWNDVGSCEAYLATCRDALDRRYPLPLPPGLTSIAEGPCWVSEGAHVAADALLGAYTVIGGGSTVEAGCRIRESVVDGALLQAGSSVDGSILSRGVQLKREVQIRKGCVLAEGVTVGEGSLLLEDLRIWPGLTLPPGRVFREDMHQSAGSAPLRFQPGAVISGENASLSPERFMRMGRSCGGERIGAAAAGGSFAAVLAEAFLLGAGAAGKHTFLMDAAQASSAAALSGIYGFDECLFFSQKESRTVVRCFDRDGLPLSRKEQRKLESALTDTGMAVSPDRSRVFELVSGTEEAVLASGLRGCGTLRGLRIACSPGLLQRGLLLAGAQLVPPEDGVIQLSLSEDGFTLQAVDENGRSWPWQMMLCAMTAAELRSGNKEVVLPYDAPDLAERIARENNGTIYRLDRDGEDARSLWRTAPWCRDGLTLALRLFSRMRASGDCSGLAGLFASLPEYHCAEKSMQLGENDTAVLRKLSGDKAAEAVSGIRLHEGDCTATIRRFGRGELRILAESCSMEAAEEFCASLQSRIRKLRDETRDRAGGRL